MQVRTGEYPVAYAFVYINGVPIAVTDTEGQVALRYTLLKDGTQIGVQSVGMQKLDTVCTQQMLLSGLCELQLRDTVAMGLVGAELRGKNDRAKFLSETKQGRAMDINCMVSSNFLFADHRERMATGKIEVRNEVDSREFSYFRQHGWCHHQINYTTNSDTLQIGRTIDEAIHDAFTQSNFAVAPLWSDRISKSNPVYVYLGRDTQHLFYRISYPMMNSRSIQLLVVVAEGGDVISIEALVYDKKGRFVKHVKTRYNYQTLGRPYNMTILTPDEIKYTIHTSYICTKLSLSNIGFIGLK